MYISRVEYPSYLYKDCKTEDEYWEYHAARKAWAEKVALEWAEIEAEDNEFDSDFARECWIEHRAEDLFDEVMETT